MWGEPAATDQCLPHMFNFIKTTSEEGEQNSALFSRFMSFLEMCMLSALEFYLHCILFFFQGFPQN